MIDVTHDVEGRDTNEAFISRAFSQASAYSDSARPAVAIPASCGSNAGKNALFQGPELNFRVAPKGFAGLATVRAYLTPKHRGNAGPEH